jgi:hypothetical protein
MKKIVAYWLRNDESFPLKREDIIHAERIVTEGEHGKKIPTLEIWMLEES